MSNLNVNNDANVETNSLVMNISHTEWIKISDEGFWVRGQKVEQDKNEARIVYQAFKEFLMWANLTRDY